MTSEETTIVIEINDCVVFIVDCEERVGLALVSLNHKLCFSKLTPVFPLVTNELRLHDFLLQRDIRDGASRQGFRDFGHLN